MGFVLKKINLDVYFQIYKIIWGKWKLLRKHTISLHVENSNFGFIEAYITAMKMLRLFIKEKLYNLTIAF